VRQSRWCRQFLLVVLAFSLLLGITPAQASTPHLAGQDALLPSNIRAAPARASAAGDSNLLTDIQAIAPGGGHTCALTTSGGVKCWGHNVFGQLGGGTANSQWTPVDVIGLSSGIQAIASGPAHSCALTMAGAVKCWGGNHYGQIGDGTTNDRRTPVEVSGMSSGIQSIATAGFSGCALTIGGAVKCWGYNGEGQVGDGTTTDRPTPVNVSALGSDVEALAAGIEHVCALTTSGGVKCWGWNESGQIGDGTTTNRLVPTDVTGLSSGVSAIAAGWHHTCALMTSGTVKCWGSNGSGQLGDGTTTDHPTPVDVNGLSDVQAIVAGADHNCALIAGGAIKCWGANGSGQLGDDTTADRSTPGDVSGLTSDVQAIGTEFQHTCALTASGTVKCWGNNEYGQLGDGTAPYVRLTPADASEVSSDIQAVAPDIYRTCVLTTSGGVKCWGDAVPYDASTSYRTSFRWTPVEQSGLESGIQALGLNCALTIAGGVKCWGYNGEGQVGDGTTTYRSTPVDVSGLTSGVQAIATGRTHNCALTTGGGAKCWGANGNGALGDGTYTNRLIPVDVSGLTSGVQSIAAGTGHTCAVTANGGVKCWGWNSAGQLGDVTSDPYSLTPIDVNGLSSGVQSVAVGFGHTCALTMDGKVKCWGWNKYGQVGDGTTTDRYAPVEVSGLSGVQAVTLGEDYTCALTTSGAVKCWGRNSFGQLGDGRTVTYRVTPGDVAGLNTGIQAIAASYEYTCAVTTDGGVKCWGRNHVGQLGVNPGWAPVDVVAGPPTPYFMPLIVQQ